MGRGGERLQSATEARADCERVAGWGRRVLCRSLSVDMSTKKAESSNRCSWEGGTFVSILSILFHVLLAHSLHAFTHQPIAFALSPRTRPWQNLNPDDGFPTLKRQMHSYLLNCERSLPNSNISNQMHAGWHRDLHMKVLWILTCECDDDAHRADLGCREGWCRAGIESREAAFVYFRVNTRTATPMCKDTIGSVFTSFSPVFPFP